MLETITITAKIQILTRESDRLALDNTMTAYRDACNYVSDCVYKTHNLSRYSLQDETYAALRSEYGLKSQMAVSAVRTVIARYKAILKTKNEWIKPVFKKPQYDLVWNRDYSLTQEKFSVNTLSGRIKLPYFSKGMEQYFDSKIYKFGTAKLAQKHGKYYLHIPVSFEVETSEYFDIQNVVGIDRGINFVVAAYDSNQKSTFISGKEIKQKRAEYKQLRKQLQQTGTPSSRRRLRAIGQRENRWMQDVNHCVSKALVENNPGHTLFVLEDLTGIRSATEKVLTKHRYEIVSWSFFDLEQKLIYKAKRRQSSVIKVDPHYTSQCCPKCGHTEKANRNKKLHIFKCKNCGYTSNDDRIGAMNLYRMGINYLSDGQVPDTVAPQHI